MPTRAHRPPVLLLAEPPTVDDPRVPPGWRARSGFDLPASPWDLGGRRWMCVGTVADDAGAAAAVSALLRGAGLAVFVDLAGADRLRFLEDLHRTGLVTAADGGDGPGAPPEGAPDLDRLLDEDQRELLRLLAAGATVEDAAQARHLSRRTANRRLADARRTLGVTTTAEAVGRWLDGHR